MIDSLEPISRIDRCRGEEYGWSGHVMLNLLLLRGTIARLSDDGVLLLHIG